MYMGPLSRIISVISGGKTASDDSLESKSETANTNTPVDTASPEDSHQAETEGETMNNIWTPGGVMNPNVPAETADLTPPPGIAAVDGPEQATAEPNAPAIPVQGSIDLNQPLYVKHAGDDERLSVEILRHDVRGAYPIVALVEDHGEQTAVHFDHNGESDTGDYELCNVQTGPKTVYAVLCRNDEGTLHFLTEAFESEDDARQTILEYGDDLVSVYPAVVPEEESAAPAAQQVTDAPAAGVNTESAAKPNDPDAVYVGGRNRSVGERVSFKARASGRYSSYTKAGTIVRLRNDSKRSLLVQPDDGSTRYWALNSSIQY
jgi:hypothetical protein